MPGFLGRDLLKCRDFAAKWYGDKLPKQIVKVTLKLLPCFFSYTELLLGSLKNHLGYRILGHHGWYSKKACRRFCP